MDAQQDKEGLIDPGGTGTSVSETQAISESTYDVKEKPPDSPAGSDGDDVYL